MDRVAGRGAAGTVPRPQDGVVAAGFGLRFRQDAS
jgi:hypothetical protein